jgi:hypothetical protein
MTTTFHATRESLSGYLQSVENLCTVPEDHCPCVMVAQRHIGDGFESSNLRRRRGEAGHVMLGGVGFLQTSRRLYQCAEL